MPFSDRMAFCGACQPLSSWTPVQQLVFYHPNKQYQDHRLGYYSHQLANPLQAVLPVMLSNHQEVLECFPFYDLAVFLDRGAGNSIYCIYRWTGQLDTVVCLVVILSGVSEEVARMSSPYVCWQR